MKYILYSPPHDIKVEGFTKANGEAVPERTTHVCARALYKHKRYINRRYRRDYPDYDLELKLLVLDTLSAAIREQKELADYSGETFEIRTYENGKIGGPAMKREKRN